MQYIQPRPSSIVAALYTARDLGCDLAILHGPSGCSFKHARLLEEDGLRVLTTSLGDNEFIFGGHEVLERVLHYAEKTFFPTRIAVVGTCVSMIIGEDMEAAIRDSGITTPTIAMDIHAGFRENIDGVMAALRPAADIGWISAEELVRQERILAGANAVERARGAACKPYIPPSRGDLKHVAAQALLTCIRAGQKGMVIMNAKKETAFMFADILLAVHEAAPDADIQYYANLSDLGLTKVRRDAALIRDGLAAQGIAPVITGALDEYGVLGDALGEIIQAVKPDFAVIVGVPHAIPPQYTQGVDVFSVTNGPRQVEPLRDIGHQHVIVEIDLHPKTLGVHEIIPSEFGETIRSLI